jgi:hypothetical protein
MGTGEKSVVVEHIGNVVIVDNEKQMHKCNNVVMRM